MPDQELMEEMVRRISKLEARLDRFQAQRPLYTIKNTNLPAQITADQNDYNPGNYDVLFLFSDASRNISGFSGGTAGRVLILNTYGSFNIVLLYNSGLSQAANRISTPTSANITLTPFHAAYLIHTGSIWNVVLYV